MISYAAVDLICVSALAHLVGSVIFLAGGEVDKLSRALIDGGIRNILYSYYYIKQMKREKAIDRIIKDNPDVRFFLDSGAFTFAEKYVDPEERKKLPPSDVYVGQYFNYIDQYGYHYNRIAEADFDSKGLVTTDEVDEWRDQMYSRWPNAPIVTIWHGVRGMEYWRSYCRDPQLLHLGIGSSDRRQYGRLIGMINEAHRWGKTVHGFALTEIKTSATYLPFDTIDSSSWVNAQKYGTTFIFKHNKFIVLGNQDKDQRALYRSYFKNIGCDPKLILADDINENRKASVIAWRMVAARLEYMRKFHRKINPDQVEIDGWGSKEPKDIPKPRDEDLEQAYRELEPGKITAVFGAPSESRIRPRLTGGDRTPYPRPIAATLPPRAREGASTPLRVPLERQTGDTPHPTARKAPTERTESTERHPMAKAPPLPRTLWQLCATSSPSWLMSLRR